MMAKVMALAALTTYGLACPPAPKSLAIVSKNTCVGIDGYWLFSASQMPGWVKLTKPKMMA